MQNTSGNLYFTLGHYSMVLSLLHYELWFVYEVYWLQYKLYRCSYTVKSDGLQ